MKKLREILGPVLPALGAIAPGILAAIGGPIPSIAAAAVSALAEAFGVPSGDPAEIATRIAGATPEEIGRLRQIDADFKVKMAQIGVDLERLAVESAAQVNATMQAETESQHWPSYTWRPFIGFCVGATVLLTACIVGFAYGTTILLLDGTEAQMDARTDALQHIPAMIAAMTALMAVVTPILGIASWFRGRMQADPNVPSDQRG